MLVGVAPLLFQERVGGDQGTVAAPVVDLLAMGAEH